AQPGCRFRCSERATSNSSRQHSRECRSHVFRRSPPAPILFSTPRREKIVRLAARAAVPTMYHFREYVAVGGLMSYGIDNVDAYRQTGVCTAQLLNGANPAELPVMQENKFLLIINLR